MDEEFLINIVIAGKKYPLTIKRHEEELARAPLIRSTARFFNTGSISRSRWIRKIC